MLPHDYMLVAIMGFCAMVVVISFIILVREHFPAILGAVGVTLLSYAIGRALLWVGNYLP
jgi:hypothetical protein